MKVRKDSINLKKQMEINLMYDYIQKDLVAQLMATTLMCLHKDFGFGAEELKRVKDNTEALFMLMRGDGICGQKITTDDCIKYMTENFGIKWDRDL